MVPNILNDAEEQEFEEQVRVLLVNSNLPPVLVGGNDNDDGREVDCVSWWLMVRPKYSIVFKMVAIFPMFHGPCCVESTFNVMRDVIDKHSDRMSIETYSSFKGIKFAPKARQHLVENRPVKEFGMDDRLFTPINLTLLSNMRNTCIHHNKEQNKKRGIEVRKKEKFEVEVNEIAATNA